MAAAVLTHFRTRSMLAQVDLLRKLNHTRLVGCVGYGSWIDEKVRSTTDRIVVPFFQNSTTTDLPQTGLETPFVAMEASLAGDLQDAILEQVRGRSLRTVGYR